MAWLLVHVEGQTEETFVNEILRSHLLRRGYESVNARIVGNARLRSRRGGIRPWLAVPGFTQIREGFTTPEEIDDSPVTAPSKRVEALVPGYEKPLLGALAILEIGLDPIGAECPHFDGWLHQLESLVA